MLGPAQSRDFGRPVAISLDHLVPRDHFYRHLDARLDLGFVREWVRDASADRGRPSIDPVVFFKRSLVMFFEGIRSERQLLALAADRLSVRWYLGYALDEALPDASGFTRIRQRLGLAVFRRFFERVVDLCQEAGLVWGKEVFADATRVPGNASTDSLVPRLSDVVDGHLVALFGGDAAPNGAEGVTRDGRPGWWDLLEACRLDPSRPPSGPYRRLSDRKVSRTDPDAAAMSMRNGRTALGYQDHYLVDGGKARIILHCLVTPGDVAENQVLLDQLRRTLFRRKLRPERLIADAKYATGENIRALEAQGIRAYMPLPEWDKSSPYYHTAAFAYDAERDVYRCPRGEVLKLEWTDGAGERTIYRARAASCNSCPVKSECTRSNQGRLISRSFHAEYLDRVRGYRGTAAYEKALRKRHGWVEPLFAEAKQWHGLGRFRLRGLVNVNIEALLVATGQNLKRWLQATGWGRRELPGMAATIPVVAPSLRDPVRAPVPPPCHRLQPPVPLRATALFARRWIQPVEKRRAGGPIAPTARLDTESCARCSSEIRQ
jgi:transposase